LSRFDHCKSSARDMASSTSCSEVDLGSPAPTTPDGSALKAFELKTSRLRVQVLSWGCYINQILTPDAKKEWKDLVVGFDVPGDFAGYHDGRSQYYGSVIGRFGNRIALGKFKLNGEEYTLATNNGPNHLHGGIKGWDSKNWEVVESGCRESGMEPYVVFKLISADMEEGYPAEVEVTVTYSIVAGNCFCMEYAVANKDAAKSTVVNITNHSYFNLSGDFTKTVHDHVLLLNSKEFTPVADSAAIPTGDLRPVQGTPFDFTSPRKIGDGIDKTDYDQIEFGKGYDHNLVLQSAPGAEMTHCATVFEPSSSRKMEVFTSEPAVQFYTGNFMDAARGNGKAGVPLGHRTGFCLETQHFPDSPNQPRFPSTVLAPGACYKSKTVHRFSLGRPLKKPKWCKVEDVHPEMKSINSMLKCVSCQEFPAEGKQSLYWEATVGDETGIMKLLLRDSKLAGACTAGASLRLQNAKSVMVNNFIRVVVDKWAVLKKADEDVSFEVGKKDISAVEYELQSS